MPRFIAVRYAWRILGKDAKKAPPPPQSVSTPKKPIMNRVKLSSDLKLSIKLGTVSTALYYMSTSYYYLSDKFEMVIFMKFPAICNFLFLYPLKGHSC